MRVTFDVDDDRDWVDLKCTANATTNLVHNICMCIVFGAQVIHYSANRVNVGVILLPVRSGHHHHKQASVCAEINVRCIHCIIFSVVRINQIRHFAVHHTELYTLLELELVHQQLSTTHCQRFANSQPL